MSTHRSTLLIPLGTRNLECLAALVAYGRVKHTVVPTGTLPRVRSPRGIG